MISPELGVSRPAMMRSRVVLPEPEGPRITRSTPSATSRIKPSTAWMRAAPAANSFDKLAMRSPAMCSLDQAFENLLRGIARIFGAVNWSANHEPIGTCGDRFFRCESAYLVVGGGIGGADAGGHELHF